MNRFFSAISLVLAGVLLAAASATAGDPIPGLDVSLQNSSGVVIARVTTDDDGKFTIDNVPPDTYVLRIRCKSDRCAPTASRKSASIASSVAAETRVTESSSATKYEVSLTLDGTRDGSLRSKLNASDKTMAVDSWTQRVVVSSSPSGRTGRLSGRVHRDQATGQASGK